MTFANAKVIKLLNEMWTCKNVIHYSNKIKGLFKTNLLINFNQKHNIFFLCV